VRGAAAAVGAAAAHVAALRAQPGQAEQPVRQQVRCVVCVGVARVGVVRVGLTHGWEADPLRTSHAQHRAACTHARPTHTHTSRATGMTWLNSRAVSRITSSRWCPHSFPLV
jgi:hypothetical protein